MPKIGASLDDGAGRRAGGVGAVAVAVASGVGVDLAGTSIEVVGVDEGVAADQLVVAREDVGARGERVVAEVALDGAALGVGGRRAAGPVVGEGRVLGPDAAVEGAEERCPRRRSPGRPATSQTGGRADELGARVGLELLEVVGLDGDDAVDLEQVVRPGWRGSGRRRRRTRRGRRCPMAAVGTAAWIPAMISPSRALHVQGVGAALGGAPREGLPGGTRGWWPGRRRCRRGRWRCRRSRT